MKALAIILRVYRKLLSLEKDGVIPVELRHKEIIGTTQDDPFDNWIEVKAIEVLGPDFEVHNTGKLQTPDLIIRHKNSGEIVCIEVKKLTENKHGKTEILKMLVSDPLLQLKTFTVYPHQ